MSSLLCISKPHSVYAVVLLVVVRFPLFSALLCVRAQVPPYDHCVDLSEEPSFVHFHHEVLARSQPDAVQRFDGQPKTCAMDRLAPR